MISTFQATKVGLMVGIGGGIPPKVKLGDIVVSRPTDQYPGVVQWDLGKTESGKFRRTGALNKPPSAADSLIDAKSGVQSLLHSIFSWWGAEGTAGAVDLGAAERETKDVDIHYGLVASGNQVIKDAVLRDRLNESLGGNPAAIANEPLMRDVLNQVDDITKALQFATTKYSRVFIIIDALDECQTSDYCRGNFLSEVFRLYTHCGVNMFATSRHIQEIIAQFELEGDTTLEIRAHEEDIRSYLDDQIKQSRRPILLKNCEVIKSEIARIVDGMFLLATFHFQSIKNKTTVTQLNEALKYLATGPQGEMAYNLAYKGAMERIENQNPDFQCLADQLLSWVVCAERPLIKEELQFALAVKLEVDQPEIEKNNFTEVSDMISVCAGLVTIDEESNVVRLIHYTTQEYFNQAHKQWIYNAQGNTARIMLREGVDLEARDEWDRRPLSLAADEGHATVVELLLCAGADPEFESAMGLQTPLEYAVNRGVRHHYHKPQKLDKRGRTALYYAKTREHAAIIELLLREDADQEAKDKRGQTPRVLIVERMNGYYVEKINNISTIMIKDFQPHPPPWFARWLSFSCPYYVPAMSQPHGLCLACVSRMVITIGMKLYKPKLIEGSPDN
ncbi:hypothetical protein TWF703_001344 [Orbilia oligospora]|uniref:Uncharacterized protein n=1 Tax=Orbilia oligospora TaxID=2813651 RepID=A0A7C8JVJ2_ORBOL|nr:hypothetical protein TWF703_001344 [Orbilia oligospora]